MNFFKSFLSKVMPSTIIKLLALSHLKKHVLLNILIRKSILKSIIHRSKFVITKKVTFDVYT